MKIETTTGVLHAGLASRSRTDKAASTRLERAAKLRVGSGAVRPALWRGRTRADPSGAASWCRLLARAPCRQGSPFGLASQRRIAFATLEMIRFLMETTGLPFGEVVREVSAMTVFTTHTPVAAGHDRFPAALVEEHLGKIREALHLSYEDFMGLGRIYPGDPNEPFCMTVLALKMSSPRQRCLLPCMVRSRVQDEAQPLFAHTTEENVPIGHINNGVHVQRLGRAPDAPALRPPPSDRLAWGRQRHLETWIGIGDTVAESPSSGRRGRSSESQRLINFRYGTGWLSLKRRLRTRLRHRPGNAGPGFKCTYDRLRPAVRHLQTLGPHLAGRRTADRAGQLE